MFWKTLIAALMASCLITSAASAADPPKLSPQVLQHMLAAQDAANQKDYITALVHVNTARAVSDRTPFDDYTINRYAMTLHVRLQDLVAADVDAEAAADIDPNVIPEADKAQLYRAALQLALNAKHPDKAEKYAILYQATSPLASDQALINSAIRPGVNGGRLPPLATSPDQLYHGPPPPPCSLRVVRNTHTLPEYPFWSTILGRQGRVLLRVKVGTDGVPISTVVDQSSGVTGLDETAVEHVQKVWRWQPQTDPACMQPQEIRVQIVFHQPDQPLPPRQ